MADELGSRLGFDVSEAVASLTRLKRELDSYSAALLESAGDASKFNKDQAQVDKLLVSGAAAAERAARGMKAFAASQTGALKNTAALRSEVDSLINRFSRLSVVQSKNAASASRGGTAGAGPLSGFVDARQLNIQKEAARLQQLQAAAGSKALQEQIRFQKVLQSAEQQRNRQSLRVQEANLRSAFGRGPTNPIKGLADGAEGDGKRFIDVTRRLGLSWSSLIKIFATQVVFAGITQVISQFQEAVSAAIDFETKLAQVQTISKEFKEQGLDATAEAVQRLSDQFGQPIEDVAAGLYNTLSNQVGNASESLIFLEESLTFSRAAVTSTADAVDLLSGVMNSYGLTVASAGNISDQLFVTIDKGRVTGDQLANTIGRILPLASALGVEFAEVNTAMAELTIQGVTSADAMTQITNVMLKLIKPTEALQKVFDEMGIASAEAGIAIFGFDGFLREIVKSGGDSSTEIGELFNQIRGTRGVIGIVTRDSQKYADTLEAITQASKDTRAAVEAANTILQTPAQQLTIELTKLRNFLVNDIGRDAVRIFAFLTTEVISAKNAFLVLTAAVGTLAVALGVGGTLALINQSIAGLKALGITMTLTAGQANLLAFALSRVALAAGALAIAVIAVEGIKAFKDVSGVLDENEKKVAAVTAAIRENLKAELAAGREGVEARKSAVNDAFSAITRDFAERQKLFLKDKEAAFKLQTEISAHLEDQLSKRKGAIQKFLGELENAQANAGKNIQALQEGQRDFALDAEGGRFERNLRNVTNPEKIATALIQRTNTILQRAREAIGSGDVDFGKQLFNEALQLAERTADTAGQRARGESQVNIVLREQQAATQKLIDLENQKAAAAAATEKKVRAELLGTARKIEEFNQINEDVAKGQLAGGQKIDAKTLERLTARRGELAKEIDASLQTIATANIPALLGLTEIQKSLGEGFVNPVTNAIGTLANTSTDAFAGVIQTLQKQADATPVDIKVRFRALTGGDVGIEGFGAGQQGAADLRTDTLRAIENSENLKVLRAEVSATATELDGFVSSTIQAAQKITGFTGNLGEIKSLSDPARESFQRFVATFREFETQALAGAASGNIEQIRTALTAFNAARAAAVEQSAAQGTSLFGDANAAATFEKTLTGLVQKTEQLAIAQNRAREQGRSNEALTGLEQAITTGNSAELLFAQTLDQVRVKNEEVLRSLGRLPEIVVPSITEANSGIQQYSEQHIRDERQKTVDLLSQPLPSPAAPAAPTQGQRYGGMMSYFANGGFAPRGTDTIPAMLSPGEFIVNAASTRKFYSELVAINSGVRPVYRAEGGSVNNSTSVGNIVLNIPERQKVNGRVLAKELRRELRRQTSRI